LEDEIYLRNDSFNWLHCNTKPDYIDDNLLCGNTYTFLNCRHFDKIQDGGLILSFKVDYLRSYLSNRPEFNTKPHYINTHLFHGNIHFLPRCRHLDKSKMADVQFIKTYIFGTIGAIIILLFPNLNKSIMIYQMSVAWAATLISS